MQHYDESRGPKTCLRCCKRDEMTMTGISSDSPVWDEGGGGEELLLTWPAVCVSSTHGDTRIVKLGAGKHTGTGLLVQVVALGRASAS
jgi:hypothetical protein